ncbi:unannotated protein [freshwater metagenome]|jgi:dienelactone hydrolase|uniref:Unannotated protein n=1 Tax=freshwater metagenome TaxID=449393 RepID=A0A6J7BGP5_9ZZZZ|nr:hypothetical protein [Actinomycetota bacterium]MSX48673.1 hypothetical protein [Actinomycetota bacterium]MSY09800.1 hypothetical protein [Actinomycetota bacterium]MSY54011.1 hypothetical protein [Actinomycetota bacterium]MSZ68399.1 hypothetical protein [Actinomycetota bacterium]
MDLGPYADLPNVLKFSPPFPPTIDRSGLISQLGNMPPFPKELEIERGNSWNFDGVTITEISWNTGWGPRTQALLLVPEGTTGPLPGALFLHSHDDVKEFGKEKIVEGAGPLPEELMWVRRDHYGDRAPANELAKRGFAVLAFDCFLWGSRRFPIENMPERLKEIAGTSSYETLAVMHESIVVSKYLSMFGATLAGLLNFDDRVALAVAQTLPEISESISAIGLSGGGCRAIYLHATSPQLRATVSIGAMATYESMVDKHIAPHSWMFFPTGLAQVSDWPGVAALGSPQSLYVQFCANDQLFTQAGMLDADNMLKEVHQDYSSDTYPVRHSFTTEMQEDAFDWMRDHV